MGTELVPVLKDADHVWKVTSEIRTNASTKPSRPEGQRQ
jgi:hypothetical protein